MSSGLIVFCSAGVLESVSPGVAECLGLCRGPSTPSEVRGSLVSGSHAPVKRVGWRRHGGCHRDGGRGRKGRTINICSVEEVVDSLSLSSLSTRCRPTGVGVVGVFSWESCDPCRHKFVIRWRSSIPESLCWSERSLISRWKSLITPLKICGVKDEVSF